MKHFVERTCTVVVESANAPPREAESHPLEAFRDKPAYVLLGPPGAGKTEAFIHEARSEETELVTARDFWKLQPRSEWRGKTIYIDGLDEVRAGSADGRTPFDGIRARLQELGCPRFRLSCREADWFGANDRKHLGAVAPNGEVQVLRLDPLSDHGILEILKRNHDFDEPAAFVAKARKRGVEDLLRNPQNLRMLVEAVADADEWPRTRAETFDMACRKLVSEENPEHQIACSGTGNPKALMNGAGDLCALLLLAGKAGVTLPGTSPDASHPSLDQVSRRDQRLFRQVVGTNLFTMPSEGRQAPQHRQIAEFLAARGLAHKIANNGLPTGRVLSLMAGFDGRIISEFRGLAGWLAAQNTEARTQIIERDPLGVVLYGDIQHFGLHDKRLLFRALKGEIVENPWLVSYTSADSPLQSLIVPDLEDDIRKVLTETTRDDAHQSFVLLVTEAIRAAAPSPELADPLITIVRDYSWRPTIRCAALEAYIRARQDDPGVSVTLRELLDDIYTRVLATQDDNLLGILLAKLYPDDLPVADLVGYLREPAQRSSQTRYGVFWTVRLIEVSTIEQMVQLLNLFKVPMELLRAESGESPRHADLVTRPPVVLLRHLLERSPESVSQEQLFYWLDFAAWLGNELRFSAPGMVSPAEFFGNWLSDHPDIQKAIIEDSVSRCRKERNSFVCMRYAKRRLFRATPPEDYGTWCADHALRTSNDEIARRFVWEAAEFVHKAKGPETQQKNSITEKLRNNAHLNERFKGRLKVLEELNSSQEGLQHTPQAHSIPNDGHFDELRRSVKTHASALQANQCPPYLLHHLARAYFDDYSDVFGETPEDRLRFLLGPSDGLYAAALAGLRGTIQRADLPTADSVNQLIAERQIHYLAYPFMVSLEELFSTAEGRTVQLSEAQTRLAVAIHFAVWRLPHMEQSERPPRWLQATMTQNPETVSGIWARCLRFRLLNGETLLPDCYELAHKPDFAPLARAAAVRLLQAFPIRSKKAQLPILMSLLQAACLHGDRTRFLKLIEKKLACTSMAVSQKVYWLTAGLFLKPGAFGDRLEAYVAGNTRRIHRLAEMTVDRHAVPHSLRKTWDVTVLATLVRLIVPYSREGPGPGVARFPTLPMQATWSLPGFIDRLAEDTSVAATTALESLSTDEQLAKWRSHILDQLHRQRGLRREATFVHQRLEQVAEVLDNGRPANAADLSAVTVDLLSQLSSEIRDGATSDWRQYWNVDKSNKAVKPKPENGCRDALLSDLRRELKPLGIDGVREGSYKDDKRADIRLSVSGFNIPIEIKRSCNPKWWSAIKTQLIAKYTPDPGTDGYGIYLVFWFGEAKGCRPVPASGRRPKSPGEVRRALIDSLSDHERRKISVCVIDVSRPDA